MTTTNKAAWMPAKKVKPLVASWWSRTVQWPSTHSTGLSIGDLLLPNVKYPFILGSNVAGTVVEVGPGVDRFRVGDGQTAGYDKTLYTVLRDVLTVPIPDGITDEQACVIPLGLTTVANALFRPDAMALDMPTVPARSPTAGGGKPRAVIITRRLVQPRQQRRAARRRGRLRNHFPPPRTTPTSRGWALATSSTTATISWFRTSWCAQRAARSPSPMAIGDGAVEAC
ncbi:hypothetical protein V1521DRAFT_465272 [Lipomyces starkeyi]